MNSRILSDTDVKIATIAASGSLSGEIILDGATLSAIYMPSAWTAANLTFQVADKSTADGGTYQDLYDDNGTEVTAVAAASRVIAMNTNALNLASVKYLKIRSGTSASAVTQAATRTIKLILKG